ncbi:MAG: hypothetical protein LBL66_04165 [Clostridiales bacterium]|jgi:hypothetical protein|nr:hypothetical protein [Clostridiales bacterium]
MKTMKMRANGKKAAVILAVALAVALCAAAVLAFPQGGRARAAGQLHNPRVAALPLPTAEQYDDAWDWKTTAENYLTYVFDARNTYEDDNGDHGGYMLATRSRKIGRFVPSRNMDEYFGDPEGTNQAWGLPAYIGYRISDMDLGEGITNLAAIASAALVGIPNLNAYPVYGGDGAQDGTFNFVKSAVAHYNRYDRIVSDGDDWGGRSGQDEFWYELLPNVLFTVLANEYGDIEKTERDGADFYYLRDILTESARNRLRAVVGMGGVNADFDHTGWDFNLDLAVDRQRNADSAAGFAYILYSAYAMNRALPENERHASASEIEQFRLGAIWSMDYLERIDFNPFYEVLAFLAPYLAARMNAEQGTDYNVAKMFDWGFSGSVPRPSAGLVTSNWGGKYTAGLMEFRDGYGYGFAMNTFDAMLGLAPTVRYDNRFAEDVAKWALCVSQSAQMYYPIKNGFDGEVNNYGGKDVYNGYNQSGKWIGADSEPDYWTGVGGAAAEAGNKPKTAAFIPYEGLREHRKYVTYNGSNRATAWDTGRGPYASGDAYTYNWNGHTDYGLYGGGHVGIFGAAIGKTDVPRILEIDLDKLDVYNFSKTESGKEIGFKMYYNPYGEDKEVTVGVADGGKLYDTLAKGYVAAAAAGAGRVKFTIPAGATVVAAEIPQGEAVTASGGVYTCGGVFLAREKGGASLAVYGAAAGGDALASGAQASGMVYAEIGASAPEGGSVEEIALDFAGTRIWSGASVPSGRVAIDTTALRNMSGMLTVSVMFAGGTKEKAEVALKVDNRAPIYDALNYAGDADTAAKWAAATAAWNAEHPESEHYGGIAAAGAEGDGIKISLPQTLSAGRDYAWASSELFTLDLSRAPSLRIKIGAATSKYSVKLYLEGLNKTSDAWTGKYLASNTSGVLDRIYAFPQDLPADVKNDPAFDGTGVYRVSVKITAVGSAGDSVTLEKFEAWHGSDKPSLEEPASYEWGFKFPAARVYNWDNAALNAPSVTYENGNAVIAAESGAAGAAGSPYIAAVIGQNPMIEVRPKGASGGWFVGVQIEGYGDVYYLERGITSASPLVLSVADAMKTKYPGITLTANVRIRVLIGAEAGGSVTLGAVDTYYGLPEWGTAAAGAQILNWEVQTGLGARADVETDAGGRAVIRNAASADNETATAGRRGAFTVDFARDPYLDITARACTGEWRVTLTPVGGGTAYELIGWSGNAGREPATASLRQRTGGALSGERSVYINVEIRGGGKSVTVQEISTYYKTAALQFGNTYTVETATWAPAQNAPAVAVEGGKVKVSGRGRQGLVTPVVRVEAGTTPVVTLTADGFGADTLVYAAAHIGGVAYALTGNGLTAAGGRAFDLRALTGFSTRAFDVSFEIGGEGVGDGGDFEFNLVSVSFKYRLGAPQNVAFDAEANAFSWGAVAGAVSYAFEIRTAAGAFVKSGTTARTELALGGLRLGAGIYAFEARATGLGYEPSLWVAAAFKQGDVATLTLPKPVIGVGGLAVAWKAVANAEGYAYELYDADDDRLVKSGVTADTAIDLAALGNPAFNYRVRVKALGDGAVFLDSPAAEFTFHTAEAARWTAQGFAAMTPGQNNAQAAYDAETGAAVITVPNSGNWGNARTLAFALDFDTDPVLAVKFGSGSVGGYHLSIAIDGAVYNLCDDTFDFGGGTLYMDINAALAVRDGPPRFDGPGARVTGVHTVQILFGVTMGENSGSPAVRFKSAAVYQAAAGLGERVKGQLAAPDLKIEGGSVRWDPVENAERYIVVVSNEFGPFPAAEVAGTSYGLAFLQVKGGYSVQVTAVGEGYYNSEAAARAFTVSDAPAQKATGWAAARVPVITVCAVVMAAADGAAVVFGVLYLRKKKKA